jgi:hypothetical protein
MVFIQSISIPEDIYFCDEFQDLKRKKKLSVLISGLLKQHFALKPSETAQDLATVNMELERLAAEKTLLAKRKEELERVELEEKNRWTIIGGELG